MRQHGSVGYYTKSQPVVSFNEDTLILFLPTKDIVGAKSIHRVQSHVNLSMHYDMEYFLGMVELAPFLHNFFVRSYLFSCMLLC